MIYRELERNDTNLASLLKLLGHDSRAKKDVSEAILWENVFKMLPKRAQPQDEDRGTPRDPSL